MRKAVITAIIVPPFTASSSFPSTPGGSGDDEQLSRLQLDGQATSSATAVSDFLFAPKSPKTKLARSSCTPCSCRSHSISMNSAPFFGYQTAQCMTNAHILHLFIYSKIHVGLGIQLFFMRGQCRNNWPTPQRSRETGVMTVKRQRLDELRWMAFKQLRFPRASRAAPGPVAAGTSVAHGTAKDTLDNCSSCGSLGHLLSRKSPGVTP